MPEHFDRADSRSMVASSSIQSQEVGYTASAASSVGSSADRYIARLSPGDEQFQDAAEREREQDQGQSFKSRSSSKKSAASDISRLSDILEEHMSRHKDLVGKPLKGIPGPLNGNSTRLDEEKEEDEEDNKFEPAPYLQTAMDDCERTAEPEGPSNDRSSREPHFEEADERDVSRDASRCTSKTSMSGTGVRREKTQKAAKLRECRSFLTSEECNRQENLEYAEIRKEATVYGSKGPKPRRSISDWKFLGEKFAHSGSFETACCILILSNTIFFGAEVQTAALSTTGEAPAVFQAAEYIYTALFTLELIFRICVEKKGFYRGPFAAWNFVDCVIVSLSLIQVLVDLLVTSSNITFMRIVRMVRVIRVLRVLRVMRFVRALRILVFSVLNTVRSLIWTVLLLAMLLYLFAILFTQAATQYRVESPDAEDIQELIYYYGSLPASIYTLFKSISNGVSWEDVVDPLSRVSWVWVALFVQFVAFTYLAVLNVVTGVFCQTALEAASQDHDMVIQEQMNMKAEYITLLRKIFRNIDSDNTGDITLVEFQERLKDPVLQAYFETMDITIDEAWNLFKLLDTDESHVIDIDEFVTGCLRLRGHAKGVDIATLLYQSKWLMQRVTALGRLIGEQFDYINENFEGNVSGRPSVRGMGSIRSRRCSDEDGFFNCDEDAPSFAATLKPAGEPWTSPPLASSRWAMGAGGEKFQISVL